MIRRRLSLVAVLLVCAAACRESDASATGSVVVQAGIVDSALSPEESLRRFSDGLPAVAALENASATRDALVRRFVRAVEHSDTNDLRAMVMSRAEFAYLYYPASPHTREPTRQPPDVVWFLHTQNSQKGITRLLRQYGGRPLETHGYTCPSAPRREGATIVWDDCSLRVGDESVRLFGGIIERHGEFKIFSYANDF